MTILVTGGAGYIGSHFVHYLLNNNIEDAKNIVVVDALFNGSLENVPKEVTFYKIDLTDKEKVKELFSKHKIKHIFHFAAFIAVPESFKEPYKYFFNNVVGTLNLIDIASKHELETFVFSSTSAVYGDPVELPMREDHVLRPLSPYGASKLMAERLLEQYAMIKGFGLAILRYFNVIGSYVSQPLNQFGLPYNLAKAFKEKRTLTIFGKDFPTKDGTAVRDYIDVIDLVEAHLLAQKYLLKNKEVLKLNLGTEKGYTVLEVVKTFNEILKEKSLEPISYEFASRRAGDSAIVIASPKKARELLGWKAKRTLKESLKSIIEWQLN